jgi:DNA-binding HxlR family transcriptional regulator
VHLDAQPQHFSALHRTITGVSRRMLTLSLRGLERDGIIARTVRPGNVRVVEYAITPLGRELSAQMVALSQWSRSRYAAIYEARETYDRAYGTALAAS